MLARALGPEDLGKYYFAISFTTIFAIFIDLGLANVLTREVAKWQERAGEFLGSVLALKLPLAIISLFALFISINALGYPTLVKNLVYISAISMVLDSFSMTFFSFARGRHNLFFESIASVSFQIVVLIFGLGALYFNLGLYWLMFALAAASIFYFIYSFSLLKIKWKVSFKPIYNKGLIRDIVKITMPFAVFAILQRCYMYFDTVLLSRLAGDREVGLYQIAFKTVFAIQFIPLAFTASLYPAFSSYWAKNREQLATSFERAMNYLIIISLPVSVGIIILSDKIMLLFKSDFSEAALPFRIAMLSLIFIFLNYPVGSLLNACDRQRKNTFNMGIVLVLSVVLNLILIPFYKAAGASITVFITNLIMFILGIREVSKIISYRKGKILSVFIRSFAAVILMGVATFYLKEYLNIFIIMPIVGIIYFAFIFIFGGIKKEDLMSIGKSFKKT
jgi:O-antigen/teichoic acid export membrane protein